MNVRRARAGTCTTGVVRCGLDESQRNQCEDALKVEKALHGRPPSHAMLGYPDSARYGCACAYDPFNNPLTTVHSRRSYGGLRQTVRGSSVFYNSRHAAMGGGGMNRLHILPEEVVVTALASG